MPCGGRFSDAWAGSRAGGATARAQVKRGRLVWLALPCLPCSISLKPDTFTSLTSCAQPL